MWHPSLLFNLYTSYSIICLGGGGGGAGAGNVVCTALARMEQSGGAIEVLQYRNRSSTVIWTVSHLYQLLSNTFHTSFTNV